MVSRLRVTLADVIEKLEEARGLALRFRNDDAGYVETKIQSLILDLEAAEDFANKLRADVEFLSKK